jgi:glycosyltransferase involved in cell wall biosynthesis
MNLERLAFFGVSFFILGIGIYLFGIFFSIARLIFLESGSELASSALHFNEFMIWYSCIPTLSGIILVLLDLFILFPRKRINKFIMNSPLKSKDITVVLTAYNDEKSISYSVKDFLGHANVKRVLVVSNNSSDKTILFAQKAGAIVFNENRQGYGPCVYRALTEGCKYTDTDVILLCEGDMTFSAYDIDKFLAYLPHADIVSGSRISEPLRDRDTQLSTIIFYGNLFVAKLLELKHLGNATFTDVGATYKICRRKPLLKMLKKLNKSINLEFNPYFLDIALQSRLKVIECPITFHKRIGVSKGAINDIVGLKIGFKMIKGLFLNWK